MTDVIIDQFQRAEIPEDQMYMIDKVVRMRMSNFTDDHLPFQGHGNSREHLSRFGIDHSELLNFELHKTNKERDDHMNQLVYKYVPPTEYDIGVHCQSGSTLDEENRQMNY